MSLEQKIDFSSVAVAYFSMEIAVKNEIPTYSGGLGVLAGDTLRSAADLSIPMIGVSLLYRGGYFSQILDQHGNQIEKDVDWDPRQHMVLLDNSITVNIEGRDVRVKAWLYEQKGITGNKNPIIFLDTDVEGNSEYDRSITHKLYGHDDRYRLAQEIVLGIGGVRMLDSLGCNRLRKYHLNEGHSSLLGLELFKKYCGMSKVRDKCVFTTHTPVPAGHDQFPRELAESMLGDYLTDDLRDKIYLDNRLNMTNLGLICSEFVNGVSKKHGLVSQSMFPNFHIASITNGIHPGTWTSDAFKKLYDKYLSGWQLDPSMLRSMMGVPEAEIWESHQAAKAELLKFVNSSCGVQMNLETITIGSARRATPYKRNDMILSNPEELRSISQQAKGINIILAGKAHPKDQPGKDLIHRIFRGMDALRNHTKVCYIENYNMDVGKLLTSGVDVWLSTPRRPLEASGTSGMKAAINGVLHFSTLDGWWLEGCSEGVTGWSIGPHPNVSKESNDEEDIWDMYQKLRQEIVPRFEDKSAWANLQKHAIAINGSYFTSHRMLQQYMLAYYMTELLQPKPL